MKKRKGLCLLWAVLAIAMIALNLKVYAAEKTGKYTDEALGWEISWTLTDEGVLTLSGYGIAGINEYGGGSKEWISETNLPAAEVKEIVIQPGFDRVDVHGVFSDLFENLERIRILGDTKLNQGYDNIDGDAPWWRTIRPDLKKIVSIEVDAENTTLATLDGVLYNKDMTCLLYYPKARAEKEYVIPETVTTIANTMFYNCQNLEVVTIGKNVSLINPGLNGKNPEMYAERSGIGFGWSSLREYRVDAENERFSSVDGVLFNKEQTKLWSWPSCRDEERYMVPEGVTELAPFAFSGAAGLRELILPASLEKEGTGINGAQTLAKITVSEDNPFFIARDGVLFDRDMAHVLHYPNQKPEAHYELPNTVKTIDYQGFYSNPHLKFLYIHDQLTSIAFGSLTTMSGLTDIYFAGTEEQWLLMVPEGTKDKKMQEKVVIHFGEYQYPPAPLSGDINGDWTLNIFDVIRLLKKVTGEDAETFADTDVNGDGTVNIFDVIRLLKYVTGEKVDIN